MRIQRSESEKSAKKTSLQIVSQCTEKDKRDKRGFEIDLQRYIKI